MTERDRRRELREQIRQQPPDAGVYAVRHRTTGRTVVAHSLNLQGARNRFDFCVATGSLGAFDPGLVADARAHGVDGLELDVLDVVQIEAGTEPEAVRDDLETLATMWRERLAETG